MYRALLHAFALLLIGCAAGTDPEPPAPQPTPTAPSKSVAGAAALPEATSQPTPPASSDSRPDAVEELTDRLSADLAADPPDWPSRSDYELVVLPFYDDRPGFLDDALAGFDHYAAVHVAAECLAGREPTPAGFRDLVGRTFSTGRDRIPTIAAEAQAVIAAILDHDPKDTPPCLRPYVTPASAVEAISAVRLARPILAANRPDLLPWQIESKVREIALAWFGRPEPLYHWACSHDHTCTLLTPP